MCAVELSSGQLASCVLHHWPSRDLKGLQDRPSCLAELLENWKRLTRMKWAWHLATSTFVLRGRRGAYGAGLDLVARLVLGLRWSPVTPRHFEWQAWHLATSTFVLRGRRGAWRHQPSFCGEGAALGDIDVNTQTSTQTSFTHTHLSHTTLKTHLLYTQFFHTQPCTHPVSCRQLFQAQLFHTQIWTHLNIQQNILLSICFLVRTVEVRSCSIQGALGKLLRKPKGQDFKSTVTQFRSWFTDLVQIVATCSTSNRNNHGRTSWAAFQLYVFSYPGTACRYVYTSHHWPLRWPSTNDEKDGPLRFELYIAKTLWYRADTHTNRDSAHVILTALQQS